MFVSFKILTSANIRIKNKSRKFFAGFIFEFVQFLYYLVRYLLNTGISTQSASAKRLATTRAPYLL